MPYRWNYWQVKYLVDLVENAIGQDFKMAVLSTAQKEIHASNINGVHLS